MRMRRGIIWLILAALAAVLAAPASVAKVYVRWTESALPPARVLGVSDLVIAWSDDTKKLVETAKTQGYRVYLETTRERAEEVAVAADKAGTAGIVLTAGLPNTERAEESAKKVASAHPKLKILVLDAGKQPRIRGWMIFQKNGILQVSSPTSQPWLDTNLALVRYVEAFQRTQAPLYSFSWDASDPLVEQNGLNPADYELAIAEAGAFHADLILGVHEKQQKGLASGDKGTLADWEQVKRIIAFSERRGAQETRPQAAVAVLVDDYELAYEPLNLMARHNIPFRVLRSSAATAEDLKGFDVIIAFAALGKELTEAIRSFARNGGVAVLVNLKGAYPWEAGEAKATGHAVTYSEGEGRIIELREAIVDPETFAQDVRRLMAKEQIPVSLWNSLTTLAAAYPSEKNGGTVVELVNYTEEATEVQLQVKGKFASVCYESPEKGCCEMLKPSVVDGFTEFVVPGVVIGGRVHLSAGEKGTAR
jgi:protein-tyrosine-phosphatase